MSEEKCSRPRRVKNNKKEEQIELLENIRKSKYSGTHFKQDVEIEDVYTVVDEITYDKLREERQQDRFIEGDDDYYDNGTEIFDDFSEDEYVEKNKRKKSIKSTNTKKRKFFHPDLPINKLSASVGKTKNKKDLKLDVLIGGLITELEPNISSNINPFLNKTKTPKFEVNKPKKVIETTQQDIDYKSSSLDSIMTNLVDKESIKKIVKNDRKEMNNIEMPKNSEMEMIENFSDSMSDSVFMEIEDCEIIETGDVKKTEHCQNYQKTKEFLNKEQHRIVQSVWVNENKENDMVDINFYNPSLNGDTSSCQNIYWIDAYQDKKIPGVVFLFGKRFDSVEKQFKNCCVRVRNLERRLYFLPKAECQIQDVYNEVQSLFTKYNIGSFRCKVVTKKYAFQITEVPDEAEYLLIQYDASFHQFPDKLTGETFSHIFGINTSCLETFILDLKLKGPCWLKFEYIVPVTNRFSTCKADFDVVGIRGISKFEEKTPPISVLSLNIKTFVNKKTNINEIISVGYFIHNSIYLDQAQPNKVYQDHNIILTHPKDIIMPYDLNQKLGSGEWGPRYGNSVKVESNERALINNFLANLQRLDPDLIVGHSLFGYQFEILLQRCQELNISTWFKLGRLKRTFTLPKVSSKTSWVEKMATAGRIVCDTFISAKEHMKFRSYDLVDLVREILPKEFNCLQNNSSGDVDQYFENSMGIKKLIDITMDEGFLNLRLMHEMQVLPLALEITSICGNLLSRTLSSGKSERNEYLLLHAFDEKGYLVPDKVVSYDIDNKNNTEIDNLDENETNYSKRKPAYIGGLVLEPKKGFYDNFILLMDFNSLYPSIIQEFNICFTTIDRIKYLEMDLSSPDYVNQQMEILMNLSYAAANQPQGILPIEIKKLVESRNLVKDLLADPHLTKEKRIQYDIRQKALKITANSIYGCLGFRQSRFFAVQLASLVTSHGRNILMKTKDFMESGSINFDKSQKIKLDIIYGDTDSLMINTGINISSEYKNVLKIGNRIKEEVNKKYKEIKLDIDGVLRRMLLLNKKKYAALKVINQIPDSMPLTTKQELKGLDVVRRDWCKFVVEVGKEVITKILEGEMVQEDLVESIHTYIKSVSDNVINGSIDLDNFVITKALARNPDSYMKNSHSQAHVEVAKRLNECGKVKPFRAKDTVDYIICIDGTDRNPSLRAYSPGEIIDSSKNDSNKLQIDYNYYLAHQLHPVVTRLVSCFEGISPGTLAEYMGLDPKSYNNQHVMSEHYNDQVNQSETELMMYVDRYQGCKPPVVICSNCRTKNLLKTQNSETCKKLWTCENCHKELLTSMNDAMKISKQITLTIRRLLKLYYSSIFVCAEVECKYVCKELPAVCHSKNEYFLKGVGEFICPHCGLGLMKPIISDLHLYNQLCYYAFIFTNKSKVQRFVDLLSVISEQINFFLKDSSYSKVDLGKLFSSLGIRTKNK